MLSELCVRRPVFATMLVMSLVVLGLFSFRDLGVDLFPKADPAQVNVSLRLLHNRRAVAAVVGAVAAPLAYYAGGRLGAVEFVNVGAALLVIGAGWVVLMPVLVSLAARLDGYATS